VTSHTAEPEALTEYGALSDASGRRFTLLWAGDGIAEVSEIIDGKPVRVADRTAAERLTNTKLFIERERLPAPDEDEYYLADLIGLTAVGVDGAPLGVVSAVHDYGAGVSVEVSREQAGSLLLPFTVACVPEVNIAAGRVTVVPPDEVEMSPGQGQTPALPRHPPARPGDLIQHRGVSGPPDEPGDDVGAAPGNGGCAWGDDHEAPVADECPAKQAVA
jgi:16S rRNA processing protein RimM